MPDIGHSARYFSELDCAVTHWGCQKEARCGWPRRLGRR